MSGQSDGAAYVHACRGHLARLITRAATQIRKRFGVPDATTEARMIRLFRAALRPRKRAGRKPDHATACAVELWTAGMRGIVRKRRLRLYQRALWQRIYREVIPDFARMDKLTRQHRCSLLRRNVKACLRRRGRKSLTRKRVVFSSPLTPAE